MDLGMPERVKEQQEQDYHQVSNDATAITTIPREHMFDKSVTPSDVGKLNRLVIPKQHAEKHFPLDHHPSSSDSKAGLLLNFEDRNGKSWRFRYSYWNSSQSYVITKGWSRFVKDKKLLAGDIVSFQRGLGDSGHGRLFIDWRRKPNLIHLHNFPSPFGLLYPLPRSHDHLYRFNNNNLGFSSDSYNNGMAGRCYLWSRQQISEVTDVASLGIESVPVVEERVPVKVVSQSIGAVGKRLRLFGVNMVECGDGSTTSSSSAIEEEEESYSPKKATRGEMGYVHSSSCSVLQLGLPSNGTTADQEHGLVVIPKKIKSSLSLNLDYMP